MSCPVSKSDLFPILSGIFSFEDNFRSQPLAINPEEYFPRTLQYLKPMMSSPLFSATDMNYCASEIQRLYPNLKPAENLEFQTLNNRIKVWKEIPANPVDRFAKVEQLPIYLNKKLEALEDLLIILNFEEALYLKIQAQNNNWKDFNVYEKESPAFYEGLMKVDPSTMKIFGKLKEIFPYLEFILEKAIPIETGCNFIGSPELLKTSMTIFKQTFPTLRILQGTFKRYVEKTLLITKFSTFEQLITQLKANDLNALKKILYFNTFEEFIVRQENLLTNYTLSNDEWDAFIQCLERLYPVKNRAINHNTLISTLHSQLNPKLLAVDHISYECCAKTPNQRISTSNSLAELNQLVSHLQIELSLMNAMELYLSTTKKPLELFASQEKGSFLAAAQNTTHTVYKISKDDLQQSPGILDHPYIFVGHLPNMGLIVHLKLIEKKKFNYKALLKSLDGQLKKTSSPRLQDIFNSMKAHVELIYLVQKNCLETDFQDHLKSLKRSTIERSLTPFLNDTQNIIQFFPVQPVTPEYFNNPRVPLFLEANHKALKKIHEGWNKNKEHQNKLLKLAQTEIKKAKQTQAIKPIKPNTEPTTATPLPDKKVTKIKTPKILKAPIAVAKALLQGAPTPPPFQIPHKTTLQVHASPPIRKLTQVPPGKPFLYKKTQRILDWENHSFGEELPKGVFSDKYTELPLDIQEKIHLFHFPHPAVDLFLHMGIEGTWESNRRVDIIAEITYNNTTFKGVIGYTFDGKECYHRCFTEKLDSELAALRAYHLKQQAFPSLERAASRNPGKAFYPDLECSISYDPLGNVSIKDTERDVIIKLFKP